MNIGPERIELDTLCHRQAHPEVLDSWRMVRKKFLKKIMLPDARSSLQIKTVESREQFKNEEARASKYPGVGALNFEAESCSSI